ncbi:PAS domain-containing protein [Streptomyces sp. MI02-7b]|uniref:hybrid sensor histidine kinase/response regulator n=1 Tax=Streptomyces sp. MI02-7b TaxID=462941 RepID=UPI0029BCD970|nr:PAS domain-containing protein [Streptomyces sp. MI02-7b]MDX3076736.1 PAS domain-containing protein [Streptomyces sp. MI02-7b]
MSSRPSRGAARLAAILDALPDALLLVNANGTVVNANSIALETFESPGTALVGRGLLDLLPSFDARRIPGSMRRPDDDVGRTKPTRMIARRTDGSEIPVEVTSANLDDARTPFAETYSYTGDELLMLVVRDLTGTLDTETELARQQRQTEMILRAASEGVIGVDTDGKIVLVNPAAAQILGFRATDLGGQEMHPLVHHSRPDGTPLPYEETPLAGTLRSGLKHRARGQVLWRKDGRSVPVDLITAPVREGDQLVGAVMTFTDRSRFDAVAARNEQLRSLLGDTLRGPLDELRGELAGLANDPAGQLWPEANQILHHLTAGYARITTLIDSVLTFQRLDRGEEKLQRETTSMDKVVASGVEAAIELIGPGRAQYAVHSPPIEATVDPERMAQALSHLIADVAGVDAAGNVPVVANSGDSTIVVAAAQRGDSVRIEVRGPHAGANPVHLPIARGIVERHGGVLQTHDVPGQGSAYVVEVPVGTAGGKTAAKEPRRESETTVMPVPSEPVRGTAPAAPAVPAPAPPALAPPRPGDGIAAPALPAGGSALALPAAPTTDSATPTGRRRALRRPDAAQQQPAQPVQPGPPALPAQEVRPVAIPVPAPPPQIPVPAPAPQPPAPAPPQQVQQQGAEQPTGRRARRAAASAPQEPQADLLPALPPAPSPNGRNAPGPNGSGPGHGTAAPEWPEAVGSAPRSRGVIESTPRPSAIVDPRRLPAPTPAPAPVVLPTPEPPPAPAAPVIPEQTQRSPEPPAPQPEPPAPVPAPVQPSPPPAHPQASTTQGRAISVRTLGQGVPFAQQISEQTAHPVTPTGRRRKLANPGESEARPATPAAPAPAPAPSPNGQSAPQNPPRGADTPGRAYAIGAPTEDTEGPEPLDGPNGAVDVTDESPREPEAAFDEPRRLLVWPEPDVSTRQALTDRGYRPVIVRSREEVDAQVAEPPAALFVDPLTGPITRTALQSLRQAAAQAEVPVLVTAGLGQATREAAYGADPAVLLKALAPRDSDQHPPRVLLIEEHLPIAQAFTGTLERRGMQVAHASSEADAMNVAAQFHPNLVVMDLMLVRRRRQGIVDWLHANGRMERTPLVVYTAVDIDPAELPRLASGETVLFLAERSTSTDVQSRIVDLLGKIGS